MKDRFPRQPDEQRIQKAHSKKPYKAMRHMSLEDYVLDRVNEEFIAKQDARKRPKKPTLARVRWHEDE